MLMNLLPLNVYICMAGMPFCSGQDLLRERISKECM